MEARAGNSILDSETLFSDFQELLNGSGLTPSTQSNLFPKLIHVCFFYVETHKVSTSIQGGFHVLLQFFFHEQVHSARSSCMAPERVRNRSEFGQK